MAKNTDIGPNDHSPCVESTPPKRITPEDIPSEKIIPTDSPNWKNTPDKPEPLENPDQKAPHGEKLNNTPRE